MEVFWAWAASRWYSLFIRRPLQKEEQRGAGTCAKIDCNFEGPGHAVINVLGAVISVLRASKKYWYLPREDGRLHALVHQTEHPAPAS